MTLKISQKIYKRKEKSRRTKISYNLHTNYQRYLRHRLLKIKLLIYWLFPFNIAINDKLNKYLYYYIRIINEFLNTLSK